MKKIIDSIMLFLFVFLCLIGFLCLTYQLPNLFFKDANTTHRIISFFFCFFVIAYTMNYFQKQKHDNETKQRNLYTRKLLGLTNIKSLNIDNLKSISAISISNIYSVIITVKNDYNINIEIEHFADIDCQETLYELDEFITQYINEKIDTTKNKIIIEFELQNQIQRYLSSIK